MTFYSFIGSLEQGLVFALMVLGVYLTFRVLDFPDLTVDGSLPLGAAVSATLVIGGMDPFLSLLFAMVAGALAGCATALLSTKLRIMSLLASIITMTALYSINLRIMGRPNLPLLGQPTIFDALTPAGMPRHLLIPLVFLVIALAWKLILDWFLHTQVGMALRATGDNPQMIRAQGVDTDSMIILGVSLSNGLVALAGGLVAQSQGFADVGMGIGTIVAGLASVILGESLLGGRTVAWQTLSALCGSLVYRLTITLALSAHFGFLRLTPSDLNLITAVLVVICLTVPLLKERWRVGRR
ncbi:MAG: ABC transporter permease [Syntrophobacteraceae bacterium]|jgi:putative ABC transport system permease protein|nr:ABC transporter permease [Syntrophobacteraceae bacterium]